MELLEGQALADRLTQGALPLDAALAIAVQIADALDKAHRAGVVHRDVKPGNIVLVRRGGPSGPPGAKLLDFGLAKTNAPAVTGAGLSMLPTTPPGLTAQGTILGTFQYMAAEQLEGEEADARTDIFGFGAVLYEMLTGRRAFTGESHASLLGAILKDEPPPVPSVKPVTPALDHVVQRCLAKTREERWQTAADVMRELMWLSATGGQTSPALQEQPKTTSPTTAMRARERIAWACVILLVLTGLAASVYVGRSELMSLGTPQILCPATDAAGGTWSSDGIILFTGPTGARFRVAATGGEPAPVTTLDASQNETSYRAPWFLPDGRRFLYLTQPSNIVFIGSLDSGERRELLRTDSKAVYAATGHLLFMRGPDADYCPCELDRRVGTVVRCGYCRFRIARLAIVDDFWITIVRTDWRLGFGVNGTPVDNRHSSFDKSLHSINLKSAKAQAGCSRAT